MQMLCLLLQAAVSDVEKQGEMAEQELRAKVREILLLEGEMENLEQQIEVLHDRSLVISKENTELQICMSEEEESARVALEGFSAYRKKMEGHRAAVLHATSETDAHKELEDKRALVSMLRQKKVELKQDLENPNGNTVQVAKVEKISFYFMLFDFCSVAFLFMCLKISHIFLSCSFTPFICLFPVQREMDALKEEISVTKKLVAERREQLQKEFETHSQIKKDIEVWKGCKNADYL